MTTRRFIQQALRPFKKLLLTQVILAISWAYGNILTSWLQEYIIDKINGLATLKNAWHMLLWPIVGFILLGGYTNLSYRFSEYLWLKTKPYLTAGLTKRLMDRLISAPNTIAIQRIAGSLGNQIKNVVTILPELLEVFFDKFLYCFFTLLFTTVSFFRLSHYLSIGFVAWLVCICCISYVLYPKAQQLNTQLADTENSLIAHVIDVLHNLKSVRLFNRRKAEKQYLQRPLTNLVTHFQHRDLFMMKIYLWQGMSFILYQGICLLILIHHFQHGQVTAGHFVFVLTLNTEVLSILWEVTEYVRQFTDGVGRMYRSLASLLATSGSSLTYSNKALQVTQGAITFDNVQFGYNKYAPRLFNPLNLSIAPGSKVGLVGYSGSGKTTFVNLLLRLYAPQQGAIYIDGQDIQKVTWDSLYQAIGMIPQHTHLFKRSLSENIGCSTDSASATKIQKAAEKADAHSFIMRYPKGYTSIYGKEIDVSSGQRQRIAIARILLKNAPILILDEATSQLDTLTRAKIQQNLFALMKGKTTIVIAHHLATLVNMDRILVFDNGKIVQDGTHATLIKQPGLYSALWQEGGTH